MHQNMFPMFLLLNKKRIQWEKCRNISVAFKQYSLNNKSQKDIRKVIETLNNGEKGKYINILVYWYIHNRYTVCRSDKQL